MALAVAPYHSASGMTGNVVLFGDRQANAYTVAEEPKPRGKAAAGMPMFGPSGVGIWSSPTIDAKRKLIAYAMDPDQQGKVVWRYGVGKGSGLGGMWGSAIDGNRVFIGTADLLTETPGAVLDSGMDGGLRACSTKTVNGVKATAGSMDGPDPVVAGGMLFVNSGNGSLVGLPGNILLAFGR